MVRIARRVLLFALPRTLKRFSGSPLWTG
uniref:Uncharacterized protein n=1 Tax=Anguilla anguilla TaxID=7936 RepID=A0A0E9Q559_ANGAN